MPYANFIPSYIEVLAGLLVFGITLPSLLINIPPRLKSIRDKHSTIDLNSLGINLQLERSLILQPRIAVFIIVFSILFFAGYLVPTPPRLLNFGWRPIRFFFNQHALIIIYGILALNVIVTAVFMWVLSSYTKDRLLRDLDNKCRRAVKKDGRIPQDFIDSLSDLGAFCDQGHDKSSVLHILGGLANLDGLHIDSQVTIASAVQNIIVDGNEQNYISAMDILQEIFRAAAEKKEEDIVFQKLRQAEILRTLENVIIQAFVLRNPRVTASIMTGYDEISMQEPNDYARAFLRIGRAALALNEEHHAGHGLDKLHTRLTEMINENKQYPLHHQEALQTYFGLLAHFWHLDNTARQHALKYLDELQIVYHGNHRKIDQQIMIARHAFEGTDLITSDYLEQMLYEYRQLQYTRKFLLSINGIGRVRSQRILVHYPSMAHLRLADEEGLSACGLPKTITNAILSSMNEPLQNWGW